jgi:RNA polymerase sigma factor (sigma-70 family)
LQSNNMQTRFEESMVPHLDAAYNLAYWLTGNNQDAQDMVQEAYLRAFKSFGSFRGGDSRAWLLTIVRNTCYTWLQRNRAALNTSFDEDIHTAGSEAQDSEKLLLDQVDSEMLRQALEELPVEFREAMVLRELEGLSYKEIAQIARVPLGTVMSRLARARKRLQHTLAQRMNVE